MNPRYRIDSETIRLRAEDGAGEVLLEAARARLAPGAGSAVTARTSNARAVRTGHGRSSSSSSCASAEAGAASRGMATASVSGQRRHGVRSSD